jgi:hypothetical protein
VRSHRPPTDPLTGLAWAWWSVRQRYETRHFARIALRRTDRFGRDRAGNTVLVIDGDARRWAYGAESASRRPTDVRTDRAPPARKCHDVDGTGRGTSRSDSSFGVAVIGANASCRAVARHVLAPETTPLMAALGRMDRLSSLRGSMSCGQRATKRDQVWTRYETCVTLRSRTRFAEGGPHEACCCA